MPPNESSGAGDPPSYGSPLPIAVVKLGGSVLTRKRESEKLRPKVLARLAREVSGVRTHRIVLLHGAGGFGHPGAVRFGLSRPPDGSASPAERIRGAAIVSAEVRRLHLAVLRAIPSSAVSRRASCRSPSATSYPIGPGAVRSYPPTRSP
ncbi:MAG: hypothetical protein LVQ64_04765 [Thermoplasmatales archaeon]|nr:hypothetical protein [Thermoplasmatales archaeon]